tara:strand:+ start:8839 stop:8991 length:153 start_codon:yes stop_codon:yes gene_type:complete
MELQINLVNDIINYLSRQPYREVANIINRIIQEQQSQQQQQEELPLDDTN